MKSFTGHLLLEDCMIQGHTYTAQLPSKMWKRVCKYVAAKSQAPSMQHKTTWEPKLKHT